MRFFEERRFRRLFQCAQTERAGQHLMRVDHQVERLTRQGVAFDTILASGYYDEYVVGILDSISRVFEVETRARFGVGLHEGFFIAHLCSHLSCHRDEARRRFAAVAKGVARGTQAAGYVEGCADGLALLHRGQTPQRLWRHLAGRDASLAIPEQSAARDGLAHRPARPLSIAASA